MEGKHCRRLRHLLSAMSGAPSVPAPSPAAAPRPSVPAELAGSSGFQPMLGHVDNESFTGGGGCTADGLIRKCSMLKVRDGGPELMVEYNEWHKQVWPELQAYIRRTGTTNCEPAVQTAHPH
jgi:hypothetical protein